MEDMVDVPIPRDALRAARLTPEELRQGLAVHLFQRGRLSFGKARELAAMTAWDFQQMMGSRGVAVHYGIDDYEDDLKTIDQLRRRCE